MEEIKKNGELQEDVKVEETKKEETNVEETKEAENVTTEKDSKKDSKKEETKSTNVAKEESKKAEEAKSQPSKANTEAKKDMPVVNEMKTTNHKFDPEDKVWVSEFKNIRDNAGFTKIENQFRFAPTEAEIEKVIITVESGVKVVRYKLKGKTGSMFDEEDVCLTYEEAVQLCNSRNK